MFYTTHKIFVIHMTRYYFSSIVTSCINSQLESIYNIVSSTLKKEIYMRASLFAEYLSKSLVLHIEKHTIILELENSSDSTNYRCLRRFVLLLPIVNTNLPLLVRLIIFLHTV